MDRLLDESVQGADTLPLLSLTLARLYRTTAATGTSLWPNTRRWVECAASCRTRSTPCCPRTRQCGRQQLELLHSAFIPWLATINPDNDQPVRRIARLSDLPAEARPLIDAMVDRRLLVGDERGG